MDEKKSIVVAGKAELIPETQNMVTLAKYLHESKMFPNAGSVAGIIAIMEYGRELGIPPVAALGTMAIINGRLTMEAKAMLAVAANQAGVSWTVDELNNKGCTMTFSRPGFQPCKVSFTEEDAKAAGLLGKGAWQSYKQDMYFARCSSRGVRRIAPDAVLGLYSSEEMRDVEGTAKQDMEQGARPEPAPAKVLEPEQVFEPEQGQAEQADDTPFPFEDAPPPGPPPSDFADDDPILNSYVAEIKHALDQGEVDTKLFKEWILGQGKKMNRAFVGKIGKGISFHKGNPDDVKYLVGVLSKAIDLYHKETGK